MRKLSAVQGEKRLHQAWKEVLQAENSVQVLEGLMLLNRSLRILKEQVAQCELITNRQDIYLPCLREFEKLLDPGSMQAQAKQFAGILNKNHVDHLFTLHGQIRLWYPQGILQQNAASELKREIDELTERVKTAELKSDLKAFVIAQLSTVSWAIANIDHLGVEGVHEIVASVMARSRSEFARYDKTQAAEAGELVGQPLKRVWDTLDGVILVNKGREAVEGIWGSIGQWFLPPAGT